MDKRSRFQLVLINLALLAIDLHVFSNPEPDPLAYGLAVISATCALLALALHFASGRNHHDQ